MPLPALCPKNVSSSNAPSRTGTTSVSYHVCVSLQGPLHICRTDLDRTRRKVIQCLVTQWYGLDISTQTYRCASQVCGVWSISLPTKTPAEIRTLWIMILDSSLFGLSMKMKPDRRGKLFFLTDVAWLLYPQPWPRLYKVDLQWPFPLVTLGFSLPVSSVFGESHHGNWTK